MPFIRRLFAELKMVWLYLPAVLSLLVVGLLTLRIVEGRDMMLYTAETPQRVLIALFSVTSWSLVLWYSSRIVGRALHKEQLSRWVNQISLGYTGILIFYLAVLNVVTAKYGWQSYILLGLPLGWYLYASTPVLWEALVDWKRPAWWSWPALPLFACASYLPYALFASETGMLTDSPLLAHFALALFWLGILYTLYTRELFLKKFITETVEGAVDNVAGKAWNKTLDQANRRFPAVYEALEKTRENWGHFVAFNLVALQILVVLIWASHDYDFAVFIGPVSALLLGLTVFLGVLNLLTFISVKFAGLNLHLLLILWMVAMGMLHDPYQARTLSMPSAEIPPRPTLEQALVHHFYEPDNGPRRDLSAAELPLYFVLSDGGAFRSAYWVAQVLDTLQRHSQGAFFESLFCLSGSSGGSVGNTLFYASMLNNFRNPQKASAGVDAYFERDLLSYSFVQLLSTDLVQHLVPIDWLRGSKRKQSSDRAVALEIGLEKGGNSWVNGQVLQQPLLQTALQHPQMPLLVYNATELQRGQTVVLTHLQTNQFSERANLADLLGQHLGGSDLSFSTAAILGARFPYLNPAGGIGNHYFVDGGYIENSGAGVAHELIMACQALLDTTLNPLLLPLKKKIKYRVIHLANSTPRAITNQKVHPLINDLGAPLLTLVAARGGQTNPNNERLQKYLQAIQPNDEQSYRKLSLYPAAPYYDEEYPMNWVISAYNRHRMQARKTDNPDLSAVLQRWPRPQDD